MLAPANSSFWQQEFKKKKESVSKQCFSNKTFISGHYFQHDLRLEVILGYAQVGDYSLHSVFTLSFIE